MALFDVRPKKQSGRVEVGAILNLKKDPKIKKETEAPRVSISEQLVGKMPVASHKEIITNEIESALASYETLNDFWYAAPAHAPIEPRPHRPVNIQPIPPPAVHLSPAARDVEHWLSELKTRRQDAPAPKKSIKRGTIAAVALALLFGGGIAAAALASSDFVVQKQEQVLKNGNNAVVNLEEAKAQLKDLNFSGAADRFALAYEDFDKASGTLNNFGASFLSVFGDLFGLDKVKSAQNLVQAGRHISKAGESLSRAFGDLYNVNFFAFMAPYDSPYGGNSIAKPIENFQIVLKSAQDSIAKAEKLLDKVESADIPSEKRAAFDGFKTQIPSFGAYIGQAVEYSDFLLGFVGEQTSKTYMVLLQNNSERRPTGGFPGTYAIVTFDRGALKKIFVDDIYNPDGQIKVNMIPPVPLQHITPNWGLRDANWFADFPASARKIQEYYKYDGGADLDGVLAITPTVIARLLDIVGPIEMPEYGVTLDSTNFLAEMQDEVEHGDNRTQPKKIIVDFQPKFFEKLGNQNKETWVEIMKVIFGALEEKHVLAYFSDKKLQDSVVESGYAGELKQTNGDYIQVAFSNIKGGKTDAVMANAMKLSVVGFSRTLTINRAHNGGSSKYAFYNVENFSYVKVYLPQGSRFVSADGFSKPNYKPLISFSDLGFKVDPDLGKIEATVSHPIDGIDVFEESGKTVIGFWLNTKAKKVSTMTLVYNVPVSQNDSYELLWQKQSGTDGDQARVNLQAPEGLTPSIPLIDKGEGNLQIIGNTAVYDADLSLDREVKIVFK